METLRRMPFKAKNSVFEKLEQIVDIASLSKEERMKYDESIKQYRDTMAVMIGQYEIGMAQKANEIAENLKSMGMPYEQISKATGLSIDEITKL